MTYRAIPDPEVSGAKLVSNFFKRSAGPLNWPETFNLSAVIRLTPSGAPTGRAFIELRPSRQYFRTGLLLKQREYFPLRHLSLPSHKAARVSGCL